MSLEREGMSGRGEEGGVSVCCLVRFIFILCHVAL